MRNPVAGIALALLLVTSAAGGTQVQKEDPRRYYFRGDFLKAAELFRTQALARPQDSEVRLWLGKSYLKALKVDDSIRELEKAVELDPQNGLYHLWLGRAYGEKAEHASVFTAFGWARKVGREFETAIRLAPENMDARFDLLEFYVEAPGIVGGGMEKAEALAKEIARADPRLGHTARARIHRKNKRWDLALDELKQAAGKFFGRAEAHTDLAEFLLDRGDFGEADRAATEAVAISPKSPRVRMIVAAARIQLRKDLGDAERSLREIAARPLGDEDPPFADVHYWLGRALAEQNRAAEARSAFQTALRFDPDHEKAKEALTRVR